LEVNSMNVKRFFSVLPFMPLLITFQVMAGAGSQSTWGDTFNPIPFIFPPHSPQPSDDTLELVATIPTGQGNNTLALEPKPEGDVAHGPTSISATDDGSIYILDRSQRHLIEIKNNFIETLPVSSAEPIDLSVNRDGTVLVLDSDASVREYNTLNMSPRNYRVPINGGLDESNILGLVRNESGGPVLVTRNYVSIALDGQNALPISMHPDEFEKEMPEEIKIPSIVKKGIGGGNRHFAISFAGGYGFLVSADGSITIPIKTVGAFGAARIVGVDHNSNVYVLVEDLAPVNPIRVEITLRRFNSNGKETGVAMLPNDYDSFPRRMVDVTPNGTVYALVPRLSETTVYRVHLGTEYHSTIQPSTEGDLQVSPVAKSALYGCFDGYPNNNGTDIANNRSVVLNRALAMINYSWVWHSTYNKFSNGTVRIGTIPSQLTNAVEGQTLIGIPYLWGGWDGIDSYHSDNALWTNFAASLSKYYPNNGPLIGNVK
jgi:hypothetical protein